jgi:hypothetical protein
MQKFETLRQIYATTRLAVVVDGTQLHKSIKNISGKEPNYFSITAKVEEEERSGTHVHTPGEMNRSGKQTSGWTPKIDRIIDRERD